MIYCRHNNKCQLIANVVIKLRLNCQIFNVYDFHTALEDVTNLLMTVDDVKMILYFNEMSACIHVWQLDILLPFKYYMIQEAMMSLDPPNFIVTSTMEDVCIGWYIN